MENPRKCATASEIVAITGPIEDAVVTRIIATGATAAEVSEAFFWLNSDDYLHKELHHAPKGIVAEICDILAADIEEDEE